MDWSDKPHLYMLSWAHMSQNTNGISIGLAVFAYTAATAPSAFQWGGAKNSQNCLIPKYLHPHKNTWFLGTIQFSVPNGISIGSAV